MENSCAKRTTFGAICLASLLLNCQSLKATEYGLGDYVLGFAIPMAGYMPPPGTYFYDTYYIYHGSGLLYQNAAANTNTRITYSYLADIGTLAWFPDIKILGGSVGFAAVSAIVGFKTDADTRSTDSIARSLASKQVTSLSDSYFTAMIGWEAGEHHWKVAVTGFAPTGNYDPNRISQTSLNRPALDIKGAYTFLSQGGTEVTGMLGLTLNAPNTATNYQSGEELHFEWTISQHLPFGLAAGVGGYYYQQITNDCGSGDIYGAFRGRVAAIGPITSYTFTVDKQALTLGARWFHEFDEQNRVAGDSIYAYMSFPF